MCFLVWQTWRVLISTGLRWPSTTSRFVDRTDRNAADIRGEEAIRSAKRSNPNCRSDSSTKSEGIRTKCISKRIPRTLSRIASCRIGSWSASWLGLASKRVNLQDEKYENAKKKAVGTNVAQNEHLWIGVLQNARLEFTEVARHHFDSTLATAQNQIDFSFWFVEGFSHLVVKIFAHGLRLQDANHALLSDFFVLQTLFLLFGCENTRNANKNVHFYMDVDFSNRQS